MIEVNTANLLAAASYGAINIGEQLLGLMKMIQERHAPLPSPRGVVLCGTCRALGGRMATWPCAEVQEYWLITGFTLSAETVVSFEELGCVLPESVKRAGRAALESGPTCGA